MDPFLAARQWMIDSQLVPRGVVAPAVLDAMRRVPREAFLPDELHELAYTDAPLRLDAFQKIPPPYVIGLMVQLAGIVPGARVLDVGTGIGYQAAVMAEMGARVYSMEIVEPLARHARYALGQLGYDVKVRTGDGALGWPEEAPFDRIVVTAASGMVAPALLAQIAPGGRLLVPVGRGIQELVVIRRDDGGYHRDAVLPVQSAPLTGGEELS